MTKKYEFAGRVFFILVSYFLFFSINSLSYAASILRVDKSKIRIMASPGSTQTGTLNIENPNELPKNVNVYLEDWVYATPDGSKDFKPAGTAELSCAKWISFSPSTFTLPAFSRQTVNYTIRIPEEAKGGHYALFFIEAASAENAQTEGVGVGLAVRIGVLLYVEPLGTIKIGSKFQNFALEKGSASAPLKLKLDFTNTGNVDITCGGVFNILGDNGSVVARGTFAEIYTLPQDSGTLVGTWKEAIPKGKYNLVLTLDLGKAKEELNLDRGPIITKEAEIEIGDNGEIKSVGELK